MSNWQAARAAAEEGLSDKKLVKRGRTVAKNEKAYRDTVAAYSLNHRERFAETFQVGGYVGVWVCVTWTQRRGRLAPR